MKIGTRDMILVSLFAAICVVAAMISKYGGEAVVPFSMLPLIAMLAGILLGSKLAALSFLIYVMIGLVGIPVFASPPYGGLGYLLKPSAGFLFGFIAGAYVIGFIVERVGRHTFGVYMGAMVAGLAVIYAIGLPYMYVVLNYYVGAAVSVSAALKVGFFPFIGFDFIKAFIGAGLALKISQRLASSKA
ncbi:biotin transport system substrate-specific component [Desulfitispora alkaliphila]|uniref:biotin transporter BioY n=1 Tax=Desulfitispora alkaliphila TaxID=622674 RepID=UPI003D24BE3F